MGGRFGTRPFSTSLNGEISVSEDESFVIFGDGNIDDIGEPSDFFDRNPVLNRLSLE